MTVRRFLPLAGVFILGAVSGGLLLVLLMRPSPVSSNLAKERALSILNTPPREVDNGNSPIVQAVKIIEPAVVNIDTVGKLGEIDDTGKTIYVDHDVRSKGSGVVITPDGYIVTNDHVIDGASRIRVTFPDGRWYYASLVGRSPSNDLAVLRVPASHLKAAEIGDSNTLQVGEWCVAVGNPLGLGSTVTVGVVSALRRHDLQLDGGRSLQEAIQTDAPINRGNSGGALSNVAGQLIGINTAILSSGPDGGSIGLGFAIPANVVRKVVEQLIQQGKGVSHHPQVTWLGAEVGPVPLDLAQALSLPEGNGALIVRVEPESPASMAGLEDDDILLAINNIPVTDLQQMGYMIRGFPPGEKITLQILSPNTKRKRLLSVILQAKPEGVPTPQ